MRIRIVRCLLGAETEEGSLGGLEAERRSPIQHPREGKMNFTSRSVLYYRGAARVARGAFALILQLSPGKFQTISEQSGRSSQVKKVRPFPRFQLHSALGCPSSSRANERSLVQAADPTNN
jgi:hypothetical protein